MPWISKYKIAFGNSHDKKLRWLSIVTAATAVVAVTGMTVTMTKAISQNGWGIGESKSISVTTERDAEGNIVKTVETTTPEPGKTGWDWLNLVGVPLSLLILGSLFQWQQQKNTDDEAREEALQAYIDRLSALLVDKNILSINTKLDLPGNEEITNAQIEEAISPEQQELLAAVNIIRAMTLSILWRFKADAERKSRVIRFLVEADILRKVQLSLSNTDISNAQLSHQFLRNVDLSNANASSVSFSSANLFNAHFTDANLSNSDLSYADLHYACLSYTNLNNADLSHAQLDNASLVFAKCQNAKFRDANLFMVKAGCSNFKGADLSNSNLRDADFSNANFTNAKLNSANLRNANLRRTELCSAKLIKAKLNQTDLSNANLSNANLENADLRGAILCKVNFKNANLSNADLSDAIFDIEELKDAKLYRTILPNNISIVPESQGKGLNTETVLQSIKRVKHLLNKMISHL